MKDKLIITKKGVKGEDGYKVFSIRIPDELVERINDLAARSGYSRNELIGKLLDFAVDRCDIEETR